MKTKKVVWIVIVFLFLSFSFLCIGQINQSKAKQLHSSQLNKITTKEGNTERTDYFDSNGRITVAAELRYATCIVTVTDNCKLERYYDDKGKPASRYNGYYGVLQEYDEKGNNISTTYLNADAEPMIMANGYATEIREYNDNKQVISIRYYDTEGNSIRTPLYGYGKINEYDENGKIRRITYVDASGNPMVTGLGYASVMRHVYSVDGLWNGKVESEFYFDETGAPISLLLGQLGIRKKYDEYGREIVTTYLDGEGEPIETNKGYTTIVRTYHADNTIATEQYYDLEGKPYALSEGQYGVKKDENQTTYLNQRGEETFNLRNLLYNYSWIIIPAAIILIILSGMVRKKWNNFFLILYICAIGYLTLMFRDANSMKGFGFFLSYKDIFIDSEARADILKNIWLFIPLGALAYRIYPKKIMLFFLIIFSGLIEGIQYISGLGFCELDDVISNGLGGLIGFGAGKLTTDLKLRIKKWYCKL